MATPDFENSTFSSRHSRLVDFEAHYRITKPNKSSLRATLDDIKTCFKNGDIKKCLLDTFPIIETLTTYDITGYLINDAIAGVIVGMTMIPQSMAFATLSTLPPQVGLYMAFFAPLTYLIFGTGKHLAWGCVAIISLMMANIMDTYDHSNEAKNFLLQLNFTHHQKAVNSQDIQYFSVGNGVDIVFDLENGKISNSKTANTLDKKILEAMDFHRIEVASGVAVITGFIFVIASIVGLSRISTIMSSSLITGFTVGISFHIATSQMKVIFGLPAKRYTGTGKIFKIWANILEHLLETNLTSLLISVVNIFVIYLVKKCINDKYKHRLRVPIPIEIIVIIINILLSYYSSITKTNEVNVIGVIPSGMPKPKFPDLSLAFQFIGDGLIIILVSYAQSLAVAKTLALEYNYRIDSKQEMLACGICSTICGFFSGYISGGSVSLSLIQANAGGKTRIASLFSLSIVFLVIMVLGPYMKYLPTCVISAIILVNLRSMFSKLLGLPNEWRTSKYDCVVWMFTCVTTIIFETGTALFVSVAFSLLLVILRSMIKPVIEIGQINTRSPAFELRSVENYEHVRKLKDMKLIKIKTPILFFNADILVTSVFAQANIDILKPKAIQDSLLNTAKYEKLDNNGQQKSVDINNEISPVLAVKTIILDISEVAFLDTMGVKAFESVIQEFESININVLITSVPENIFSILQSTGFWKKHEDRLFLNIPAALFSIGSIVDSYKSYENNNMIHLASEEY